MADRFTDPGWSLRRFAQEIHVRCPRCDGRAVVVVHPDHREGHGSAIGLLTAPHRLSCHGCGHAADWHPRRDGGGDLYFTTGGPFRVPRLTGPEDPFFGLPLWLQRPCCGQVLWAYNTAQLDLLEQYVTARLRERSDRPGSQSLLERLPAWIKAADNRDAVLAAIRALR
jgi:hypothetical protein